MGRHAKKMQGEDNVKIILVKKVVAEGTWSPSSEGRIACGRGESDR